VAGSLQAASERAADAPIANDRDFRHDYLAVCESLHGARQRDAPVLDVRLWLSSLAASFGPGARDFFLSTRSGIEACVPRGRVTGGKRLGDGLIDSRVLVERTLANSHRVDSAAAVFQQVFTRHLDIMLS
jgi:hypothetical protein